MAQPNMTQGLDYVASTFGNTSIINIDYLLSIIIVMFVLLLISRKPQTWKWLAFPVTIAVHIMGIQPHILWYSITSIMFAIAVFSTELIGNILSVKNITRLTGDFTRTRERNRFSNTSTNIFTDADILRAKASRAKRKLTGRYKVINKK